MELKLLFLFILCSLCIYHSFKIIKTEKDEYYILYPKKGTMTKIPDIDTLKSLAPDQSIMPAVMSASLSKYSISNHSLPSLKLHGGSRDDLMKMEILKTYSVAPPTFWLETYFLGNALNPSIERWKGRLFFAWRKGMYDQPMNFAWISFEKLAAINKHGSRAMKRMPRVGGLLPFFDHNYENFTVTSPIQKLHEDPRLIARKDGTLFVLFNCKVSLFKPAKQCIVNITTSPSSSPSTSLPAATAKAFSPPSLSISAITVLDGHPLDQAGQKNWIPIDHDNTLYYLSSVNPLVVLKQTSTIMDPQTGELHGQLEVIHQETQPMKSLPYLAEYGSFLRGGTPGVLINGYYLTFFHSVTQLQKKNSLRTYFMGAMTFCPEPPFHLHAILSHPILEEQYYQGPWVEPRRLDYVMFAIGLVKEDDDGRHILVSFGHQDKYACIARMDSVELMENMEIVRNCTPHSSPNHS